jgi:hypothetical protein
MSETLEIPIDDFKRLIKVGRAAVGASFVMLVLMLFHVLIDFFYHA